LQALCASCDRFKSSYLDRKVLKPIYDKDGKLNATQVNKIQMEHYFQKTCQPPTKPDDDDKESDDETIQYDVEEDESPKRQKKETVSPITENVTKIQEDQQKTDDIEIKVGNTLIRVSSLNK